LRTRWLIEIFDSLDKNRATACSSRLQWHIGRPTLELKTMHGFQKKFKMQHTNMWLFMLPPPPPPNYLSSTTETLCLPLLLPLHSHFYFQPLFLKHSYYSTEWSDHIQTMSKPQGKNLSVFSVLFLSSFCGLYVPLLHPNYLTPNSLRTNSMFCDRKAKLETYRSRRSQKNCMLSQGLGVDCW
jgi:hypothetical protein